MKPMYKGAKPCVGCGRTGEEHPRFSKDGLCNECLTKLNLGREMSEFYGMKFARVTLPELSTVDMKWYEIPYIQSALQEFLESVSEFSVRFAERHGEKPIDSFIVGYPGSSCGSNEFVIPTKSVQAARNLCKAFKEKMIELEVRERNMRADLKEELNKEREKIFNEGVRHGRNLLLQLNNGEISINDFYKNQPYKKGSEQ